MSSREVRPLYRSISDKFEKNGMPRIDGSRKLLGVRRGEAIPFFSFAMVDIGVSYGGKSWICTKIPRI